MEVHRAAIGLAGAAGLADLQRAGVGRNRVACGVLRLQVPVVENAHACRRIVGDVKVVVPLDGGTRGASPHDLQGRSAGGAGFIDTDELVACRVAGNLHIILAGAAKLGQHHLFLGLAEGDGFACGNAFEEAASRGRAGAVAG